VSFFFFQEVAEVLKELLILTLEFVWNRLEYSFALFLFIFMQSLIWSGAHIGVIYETTFGFIMKCDIWITLVIQWNSLKTSPVKMFPRLRRQDNKAPKFSHLINITRCTFNKSPHKKIFCLRSNKSWWNNFFTRLVHFLYQNLKQVPRVSIRSVSKMQRLDRAVSSYRLISRVISASLTQQYEATSSCRKFRHTSWHNWGFHLAGVEF
jgi:hypothetical protein